MCDFILVLAGGGGEERVESEYRPDIYVARDSINDTVLAELSRSNRYTLRLHSARF